ncbi:hypothetical protein [Serratia rhizosphaerae]|uniref:Uncharacterized protein n=1 Tax=Serratia rhizosphaerae TaxID=2597702 RepID=A0ABX6GPX1_9GAMM|nr:hypothetical protein [Serratia rhizosphaerae]MEB6338067.1 hypothetical protein [Serratia rhizosphaerae]QHA88338.1 hypothetical protein FO014_15985 [Serratia rhizosphaerae]
MLSVRRAAVYIRRYLGYGKIAGDLKSLAKIAKYSTEQYGFIDKYPLPAAEMSDDIFQDKPCLREEYFIVLDDGAMGKFQRGGNNKKPGG